jgi:hypothetical protein
MAKLVVGVARLLPLYCAVLLALPIAATALTPSAGLPPNCELPGPQQDEIVAFIDAGCFRFMADDPHIRSSGPIVIVGNQKLDLSTHNRVHIAPCGRTRRGDVGGPVHVPI